jgi:gas vesicle protein
MARHEDDEVVVVEKRGSAVGPFLWGLAIGAAVALLFAPMSGQELRGEIRTRGRRLKDLARDKAEELEEMLSENLRRARTKVEEGVESARGKVREGRQFAHDVADAGRSAATTAREELERRLAQAREARRAVKRPGGEEEPVA